jgi:parallel beta-helix repeat protein
MMFCRCSPKVLINAKMICLSLFLFGCQDDAGTTGWENFPDNFTEDQVTLSGNLLVDGVINIPNGVHVLVSEGSRLDFKLNSGLVVDGTLTILGTQDSQVQIKGDPQESTQSLIHLSQADSTCTIRYCTFISGFVGISSYRSSIILRWSTFEEQTRAGIEISGDDSSLVSANQFRNMRQISNGGYGIILTNCDATEVSQNQVENCVVGIYVRSSECDIRLNEISSCGLYGLEIFEGGHPEIYGNTIQSCGNYGVVLWGVSDPTRAVLRRNTIQNNQAGIWLRYWDRWDYSIVENNFLNNTLFSLGFTATSDHPSGIYRSFSVSNNYWGSTDSLAIAGMIQDGHEVVGMDTLQFMPVAQSPFGP